MGQPWYRRYASDFIAGTWGLSLEEKGAYSLVLDLIYANDSAIPDDAKYIAGVCGCSVRKWNAIRARLIEMGKLTVTMDEHLTNPKAEREMVLRREIAQKLAENGSKGGNKSAQMAGRSRKISTLGQARLNHIQNHNQQNQNGFEEEEVMLDRFMDETIWKACVAAGWKPKPFGQHQPVSSSILSQAMIAIRTGVEK